MTAKLDDSDEYFTQDIEVEYEQAADVDQQSTANNAADEGQEQVSDDSDVFLDEQMVEVENSSNTTNDIQHRFDAIEELESQLDITTTNDETKNEQDEGRNNALLL